MKSNYRKLGEYIREINIRNSELIDAELLGVSVSKEFMPSIANTVGTDFSKYKIVKRHQFTYIPDTSRRGDKIGIALLEHENIALVSQAYTVFEIIDTDELLPEYLMMWFRRPEFDRYARFKSEGSVREIFSWNEMCNVELPIPTIEKQRKIVEQYNQINKAIQIKESINNNLEQQAICLYKNIFDDAGGSNSCRADEYFDITIGKTPSRDDEECFSLDSLDTPWISIADMGKCSIYIDKTSEYLTQEALCKYNVKIVPANTVILSFKLTVGRLAITSKPMATNEAIAHFKTNNSDIVEYLYCYLKTFKYKSLVSTSSIATAFNSKIVKAIPFNIPNKDLLEKFNKGAKLLFQMIRANHFEINSLNNLKNTLLPKLMLEES